MKLFFNPVLIIMLSLVILTFNIVVYFICFISILFWNFKILKWKEVFNSTVSHHIKTGEEELNPIYTFKRLYNTFYESGFF